MMKRKRRVLLTGVCSTIEIIYWFFCRCRWSNSATSSLTYIWWVQSFDSDSKLISSLLICQLLSSHGSNSIKQIVSKQRKTVPYSLTAILPFKLYQTNRFNSIPLQVNYGIHHGVSLLQASWLPVILSIGGWSGKIIFGNIALSRLTISHP